MESLVADIVLSLWRETDLNVGALKYYIMKGVEQTDLEQVKEALKKELTKLTEPYKTTSIPIKKIRNFINFLNLNSILTEDEAKEFLVRTIYVPPTPFKIYD